jgi:hypothetical protein
MERPEVQTNNKPSWHKAAEFSLGIAEKAFLNNTAVTPLESKLYAIQYLQFITEQTLSRLGSRIMTSYLRMGQIYEQGRGRNRLS